MSESILESPTKEVIIESTFTLNKLATDVGQGHTATAVSCNDYSNFKNENYEGYDEIQLPSQISQKIGDTMSGISVQKNDAYGLVLTNTGISPSITDLVNEPVVISPMATMSCDLHTTESASKDNHLTDYERIQLIHTVEHSHSCATALCDHESDSEHQSYEQVCTYEKVQPCDVQHLLDAPHQGPSVHSNASTTASTNARRQLHVAEHSHIHLCTTASDHESDSEHQSYEQVCTYEKVQPCDVQHLLDAPHEGPSVHSNPSTTASTNARRQLHVAEHSHVHLCTTASDHESDSEHQSYEQVCTYEKVQPCDVQHLLDTPHEGPSVHSNASTTASTNTRRQLHVAEHSHIHLCTTASDHESDSEHQSYEQVCTYEKVQPCDLRLLHLGNYKEAASRDPPVQSEETCTDDSTSITSRDDITKASPAESLNSYERVWGYERIYHCDLPLEKLKDINDIIGSDSNR